ncbi:hypothetical protein Tco_1276395 [Tanacetum coccineum]
MKERLDFQDSFDDEEYTRSSQEYMNDLEMKFHERALLAKSKSVGTSASKSSQVKNQGLIVEANEWDEEEVSSDDNETVEVKVLMALADDESGNVGKESARISEWVKISMRKCTNEKIPNQKRKILGVGQLTEDPSSSGNKDLVLVKSLADDTNMSIPNVERPWLSETEEFNLPNPKESSTFCSTPLPPLKVTSRSPSGTRQWMLKAYVEQPGLKVFDEKRRIIFNSNKEVIIIVPTQEDTAYLCLDFTRNHEDLKTNTPYLEEPIRHIEDQIFSVAKMKVIKEESEALGLLMINDDLFTCDTPLGIIFNEFNRLSGMDDDLFTYEVKISKLSYSPSVEQQMDDLDNGNLEVYERRFCYDECEKMYVEAMIFVNKGLVRLINVTLEQWLDLKYGDHMMVRNDVKESVIATWLIYKKQFDDYMEIKKQKEVYELDAGMEYNPSNVDFDEWLASKFSNYMMMDWYTKNALWIYWTRGDDEDVIRNDKPSNHGEENLIE